MSNINIDPSTLNKVLDLMSTLGIKNVNITEDKDGVNVAAVGLDIKSILTDLSRKVDIIGCAGGKIIFKYMGSRVTLNTKG